MGALFPTDRPYAVYCLVLFLVEISLKFLCKRVLSALMIDLMLFIVFSTWDSNGVTH